MDRRRLAPLVLVVTALLAIVALAARGRPLGTTGGRSSGLPQTFWDLLFTSLVILLLLAAIVAVAAFVAFRRPRGKAPAKSFQVRTARALAITLGLLAALAFVGFHIDLSHLLHPNGTSTTPAITTPPLPGQGGGKPSRQPAHFRWEELVAVLVALLALGAVAATRSRLRPTGLWRRAEQAEALAAALDESLDDLRDDPDLRRAIIAAYARMEGVLGAAGLPRRPAEAPLEYLERTLLALETSADAVGRLTDLFEWARFSQHEPEPAMRDEAVDALVAVRDELRAGEPVPA
jgi:Domain of unknown function (DUF4129)